MPDINFDFGDVLDTPQPATSHIVKPTHQPDSYGTLNIIGPFYVNYQAHVGTHMKGVIIPLVFDPNEKQGQARDTATNDVAMTFCQYVGKKAVVLPRFIRICSGCVKSAPSNNKDVLDLEVQFSDYTPFPHPGACTVVLVGVNCTDLTGIPNGPGHVNIKLEVDLRGIKKVTVIVQMQCRRLFAAGAVVPWLQVNQTVQGVGPQLKNVTGETGVLYIQANDIGVVPNVLYLEEAPLARDFFGDDVVDGDQGPVGDAGSSSVAAGGSSCDEEGASASKKRKKQA